ncbi:hypothetical protein M4I32_01775 [Microbacterium sp. LRZ72]|uniref:hypothetical protein n=1 Tax=Microbacterium sp. LRZ72 TaxID=2942481 RepID=UPI0029A767AE|nr:hypothetical protein [Microbacterium sp. LRZ72]MDX2375526.1 hypothetical protein [Microbacterium sp. LRZ72]
MSQALRFPDSHARDDLLTFASRSARLADADVRLVAARGTLAMWAPVLTPRGLLDSTPTVLALRALPVDPELECDLTVAAGSVVAGDDERSVRLPPTATRPAWAGVTPPRAGWQASHEIAASDLAARAHDGVSRVAAGLPRDAGADLVHRVRAEVWAAPVEPWRGLPLGAAFAALSLGFIVGSEQARVFVCGSWTRLSLERGHVLVRGATMAGPGS